MSSTYKVFIMRLELKLIKTIFFLFYQLNHKKKKKKIIIDSHLFWV